MAPVNKARAAGVSASSFFDLKAELAKKEEQFAKDKAAGKSTSVVGGVKRPDKVRAQSSRYSTSLTKIDILETDSMGQTKQRCQSTRRQRHRVGGG